MYRVGEPRRSREQGDYLISGASPILIELGGRQQLVVFAGSQVNGVDPENGRVLWTHPHDPGNDFNFSLPLFGDNVLFMSSGYRAGSRAIRLTPDLRGAEVDEVLSQFKLFDTTSWTVPTLAGTILYARDREKIVALDLGAK